MTVAVDSIIINFSKDGNKGEVWLNNSFQKYEHMALNYITFTMNYKNVSASFGNNIFYLKNDGTVSITLADGLYDIEDLNSRNLVSAISGRFYKILTSLDGLGWSVYSYATAAD